MKPTAKLLLALALFSTSACGSATWDLPSDASADRAPSDASPDAAPSSAEAGLARCWPDDPSYPRLDCAAGAQFCVDDWAGSGGFTPHQQCHALPTECLASPTCACLRAHFRCGITTTCGVGANGMPWVVCQPD